LSGDIDRCCVMPTASSLHDRRRLSELRELAILDTTPASVFDDLALAHRIGVQQPCRWVVGQFGADPDDPRALPAAA
jgi:hypothetical protein